MNSETVKFIVHQVADRIGLAINAKLTNTGDGQSCECFLRRMPTRTNPLRLLFI